MSNSTLDKMSPQERKAYRANQKRTERDNKLKKGLARMEVWVRPEHRDLIRQYAQSLNDYKG